MFRSKFSSSGQWPEINKVIKLCVFLWFTFSVLFSSLLVWPCWCSLWPGKSGLLLGATLPYMGPSRAMVVCGRNVSDSSTKICRWHARTQSHRPRQVKRLVFTCKKNSLRLCKQPLLQPKKLRKTRSKNSQLLCQ